MFQDLTSYFYGQKIYVQCPKKQNPTRSDGEKNTVIYLSIVHGS